MVNAHLLGVHYTVLTITVFGVEVFKSCNGAVILVKV